MGVLVAAAQIAQSDEPAKNAARMVKIIHETRANIICFPETSLTGNAKLSAGELSRFLGQITAVARQVHRWVICGGYYKPVGGKVYNGAYVCSLNGAVVAMYRKRRLWPIEEGVTPGQDGPPVVRTEFGNIGVITCWDIAFPDEARSLARRGADIIFCPAYWYGKAYGTTLVATELPLVRAFENQVFFVFADAYAKETARASRICSPTRVLSAAAGREEVIVAELDLHALAQSRNTFDCWPGREREPAAP